MKTLELNELENLQGGSGGFWTAFTCSLTILGSGAFLVGTAGTGVAIAATVTGFACGGLFGEAAYSGSFE